MAYWRRTGDRTYRPTEHVGGAWDTSTQHIATLLGVLAHAVERDRDGRRDDRLPLTRLSFDILGTVPLEEVTVDVRVERPGRTIELVRASASHGGRDVVVLRAWLVAPHDTADLAGTDLPPIPGPAELEPWDMSSLWPGGFVASLDVRRRELGPGRAAGWVRTGHELVEGEAVSRFAAAVALLDLANGMAVRADPTRVAFPNLDLTAHFLREPAPGWLGFDITVSFGGHGHGVTSTVVHDERGPVATVSQALTVRP
ncbi:thioesterase family protein [Nocardioides sp. SYSU DS0651]|uniref:thioesterase family protein n=1 Tax=Nocardioides sp. SYSU DS0651 TaxID=3415955 RepID=UPI003F4C10D5